MAGLDHAALLADALYQALRAMGPDTDRIARLGIRTINGDPVGELVLSTQDVERLLAALAAPELDDPDDVDPYADEPIACLGVGDDTDTGLAAEIEAFFAQGGEA